MSIELPSSGSPAGTESPTHHALIPQPPLSAQTSSRPRPHLRIVAMDEDGKRTRRTASPEGEHGAAHPLAPARDDASIESLPAEITDFDSYMRKPTEDAILGGSDGSNHLTAQRGRRVSRQLAQTLTVAMVREEEERLRRSSCVILPDSQFKNAWDVVMIFLLGYVVLVLPYRVAFDERTGVDPVEVTVDLLFFCDIVFTFFTAFEDAQSGTIVTDKRIIASRYLRGWFTLDVVATFPFYLVVNSAASRFSSLARVPRLLKLFRLMRLLKLLRAYRFRNYFQQLEYSPRIHPGMVRIGKVMLVMLMWSHWCACLFYFAGDFDEHEDSWVRRLFTDDTILDDEEDRRYLLSLYFAVTTLTSVGFGDITARTNTELGFTILIMLVGSLYFAYVTATISSIVHSLDVGDQQYRANMDNLRSFLAATKLPEPLTKRIVRQMMATWKSPLSSQQDVKAKLMNDMPPQLRAEVYINMYDSLIDKSPLFQHFNLDDPRSIELIAEMLHLGTPLAVPSGEMIAHFNEPVDKWFLVVKGSFEIVSSVDHRHRYGLLRPGSVFGDLGLFGKRRWYASYRARTQCHVLAFPPSAFTRLVQNEYYADSVKVWREYAEHRMQKLETAKKGFSKNRASARNLGNLMPLSPAVEEKRNQPGGDVELLHHKVDQLMELVAAMRQEVPGHVGFEARTATAADLASVLAAPEEGPNTDGGYDVLVHTSTLTKME